MLFSAFTAIFLIISFICYWQFSEKKEEETEAFFMEKVENVVTKLDNMVNKMDTISCQLFANGMLQKLFLEAGNDAYKGKNYFEYNIDARKQAQDILWMFNSAKREIAGINIFSESSYVGLRYSPSVNEIQEISAKDQWEVSDDQHYKILGPHMDEWEKELPREVISLVRPFIATNYKFVDVGVIEVQQEYSKVATACEPDTDGLSLLVMDKENQVIYDSADSTEELRSSISHGMENGEPGSLLQVKNNGIDFVMTYSPVENAGWNVVLLQDRKLYQEPVKKLLFWLLMAGFGILLGTFGILTLVIKKITSPVMELASNMEKVKNLEGAVPMVETNITEMQVFQMTFQQLLDRIRDSAGKLLLAKETELNLRIMALQAQINPHFLFNSLNAISAVALEEKDKKVPLMCYQLSELFRYTSSEEETVTLKQEIQYIQIYMDFMKWRYEDNFLYEIQEQGNTEEIRIPKLTLQPLVENTFTHAFKQNFPPYRERISVLAEENGWTFEIADSGLGFSDEKYQKIMEHMSMVDHALSEKHNYELLKTEDMAILNIYIRLKLQYKEAVSVSILRDKDLGGALIRICVKNK